MPICPNCNTQQARRKEGACPNCAIPILIHDGEWFAHGAESPGMILLEHFEQRASERQSLLRDTTIHFQIPRKGLSFQRELVAARQLLTRAGNNLELALRTIDVLYSNATFSWKNRSSLLQLHFDFDLALVIDRKSVV